MYIGILNIKSIQLGLDNEDIFELFVTRELSNESVKIPSASTDIEYRDSISLKQIEDRNSICTCISRTLETFLRITALYFRYALFRFHSLSGFGTLFFSMFA